MKKLIYGVGINDADYVVAQKETIGYVNGKQKRKLVWRCPFYQTWASMLMRCFSGRYIISRPTYENVTCCEEWLVFSEFKRWMEQQDWEGKQLDKDIIFPENKIYSPETCAFVSCTTNTFILTMDTSRGEYPLGVYWEEQRGKFKAMCSNPFTKKGEHLGRFNCPKEAHEAWRKRKHELAQLVAETESDPRVVEALKKRYSVEEWYGQKT